MAQNELVHSGKDETTEGFYVFRMPYNRKAKRKAKAKVAKRSGPGRPRVYNGIVRRTIASYLRKHGYTHGLKLLKKERKLKVSQTLARSVAEEAGLTFKRGRPAA